MHIEFVDQTIRDGQQSLWGGAIKTYEMAPALPYLSRAGYRTIDLFGGVGVAYKTRLGANPWEEIAFVRSQVGDNELRSALRTISVASFVPSPEAIIDLFIHTVVRNGVKSIWLYDCLFDLPHMKRTVEVTLEAGGDPVPSVMYGLTDVHTDEYFSNKLAEMASWEGIRSIYIEDAPGVLHPDRAKTLLPALVAASNGIPLEAHFHNTTNLAEHNYIIAMQAGINILHTASRPLANDASLPSTESMVNIVEYMGHTHSLDTSTFEPVAENFRIMAKRGGHLLGAPVEFDPRIYDHQLPGGMRGTLIKQLEIQGLSHRFPEVLEAIPQVRRDLGEPVMATPFSQLIGVQAVMNLISGDPYSLVPDEIVHYLLGHYGPVPGPVNQNVKDRILSSPHAKELALWERPNPTLKSIRAQFGAGISDEELLMRWSTSDEETDRVLNGPGLQLDPRLAASEIVNSVADLIREKRAATALTVNSAEYSVSLAKRR